MVNPYRALFSISWQNGLVYRTSLFLWRLRQVISMLMALTIWTTAYSAGSPTLTYSQPQMLTYIFLTGLLQSVVLATALQGLTNFIYSGQLNFLLTKPINIYVYLATQDAADKLKNLFFIILENTILFFIFKPIIIVPHFSLFLIFILFLLGAVVINFFISLIFGAFGFWSPDNWGPRFIFYTLITFSSGTLFPLDILPQYLQKAIYFTPLPYLTFIQTQLFMNRLSPTQIFNAGFWLTFWVVILGTCAITLWQKGMKNYNSAGS